MTAQIRWLWARLNANYWFYPALFAVIGAALAFLLVWIDRSGAADFLDDLSWFTQARPDGASRTLTVMASAMIAVASTVFSITIVAVSYASGTYGPRLLTNFMEDKGNQFSLATFIGTFVYAITVLRAVRGEDETASIFAEAADATVQSGFVPQLSLLVAYILLAVAIGVLVYFLNHVPSGIRIDNVLKGIGKRLIEAVHKTYPEQGDGDANGARPTGVPVHANKAGYIQLVDFAALDRLGREADRDIVLKVRTGDFVHPGVVMAELCGIGPTDDLCGAIHEHFSLGASRTPEQDAQFLIDELVEIGLRALSPGINDPFTAITALHWLGAATAELGTRSLEKRIGEDDGEPCRVWPLTDDFAHYVARGFGAFRSAAATSRIAAMVMFDCLENAAAPIASPARREVLRLEGRRLIEQARTVLTGPDLATLENSFTAFNRALSPSS
ncbi:DUF2254 domain-containing protein [Altererythrobacter sp. KTW20L]|uniref:DUF2254 domain-containing protein n=1 Tax=Altererythrobacter sp. KTW20L TaxID=2942210 RepID=UPI0020BE8C5D|nr:DUF2254 domain-containing protein [Altererythrobacter sp. KTW20L]MCL6250883.1 DUF2254 domain-containing protein [Altererythrobacter sp. KTW20L]